MSFVEAGQANFWDFESDHRIDAKRGLLYKFHCNKQNPRAHVSIIDTNYISAVCTAATTAESISSSLISKESVSGFSIKELTSN